MLTHFCDNKLHVPLFFFIPLVQLQSLSLCQQSSEDLLGYSVLNHVYLTSHIPTSDVVFKNKTKEFV